jgi:1,4-alpha-glucan branching enzyme
MDDRSLFAQRIERTLSHQQSCTNLSKGEVKMKQTGKKDGLYIITLHLPPGTHEYKFVVDDTWQIDSNNPETVSNAFESMNSVVTL